jgi:hypothetical protein
MTLTDKHRKILEKDQKLRVAPEQLSLTLTCREPVTEKGLIRYIGFRNYQGKRKTLAIALKRLASHELSGECTAEGLATLQTLAHTGNRNFWDQMSLENHGDAQSLMIEHICLDIHYDIKDSPADDRLEHIRIVDSAIASELAAGNSTLDLEPWARASRCKLAELDCHAHPAVILAVHDLGKTGSDGSDQFPKNPKYASPSQRLCSEFVSWYYHEAGVVINKAREFRRIDLTRKLREAFAAAKRLYHYDNVTGKFFHTETGTEYSPRSGDFLERNKNGVSKHSMLVVSWNAAEKVITVVNGPWPVTLRRIKLSTLEQEKGVAFYLGRVSPFE